MSTVIDFEFFRTDPDSADPVGAEDPEQFRSIVGETEGWFDTDYQNDNCLEWPFIPFPSDWYGAC